MEKLRTTKQSGFTILEGLLAILFVGLALLVSAITANVMTANRIALQRELALVIARSEMESLQGMPFTSLPESGAFVNSNLELLPSSSGSFLFEDYNDSTKQVSVSVNWTNLKGSVNNVTLTTLLYQYGY